MQPDYLDGCPNCTQRNNEPRSLHDEGGGVRANYRCSACLWSWTTAWTQRGD